MTPQQLWQASLGELEILLSKPNFNTWFKETFIVSHENNRIIVAVPNAFTKNWLEKKYHPMILKALRNISAEPIKEVIYKVETARQAAQYGHAAFPMPEVEKTPMPITPIPLPSTPETYLSSLNPQYTFEKFIAGKYCELANAAALAVAAQPGEVYNPLFIYGGVGLGKTHLLHAIGHEVLRHSPGKKILFVTCEKFTNDYIQAVRSGKAKEFKEVYRNVDVLLIDDIQFLSSKEGTQEEFFHTFNTLHQTNRQVVITSDRPPKAIPAIENRLLSRLEWGMIADVAAPDLETRIAIVETRAKDKNMTLSPEILNYIATIVHSNIRELEGALNRVNAHFQLSKGGISLEQVKQILSSITATHAKKSISAKQLINIVAEFFNVDIADLLGECRKKELSLPRQITMYLMREELKSSYPMIGSELGGRDHTTAIHAYNKIAKEVEASQKIKQDIDLIRQRIYNI